MSKKMSMKTKISLSATPHKYQGMTWIFSQPLRVNVERGHPIVKVKLSGQMDSETMEYAKLIKAFTRTL